MFERFLDRSRRVLVVAQEEARLLGHPMIGTEHLLLGLLRDEETPGGAALHAMGVSVQAVRDRIAPRHAGQANDAVGAPPFSPGAKKALELSLRSALQLGDDFIGTEHLLLGILRQADDPTVHDLMALGVDVEGLDRTIVAARPGPAPQGATAVPTDVAVLFTPAARAIFSAARRPVGSGALGSHHLLLAIYDDPDSVAAKALAALGISRQAVEGAVADIEVDGTTDAV